MDINQLKQLIIDQKQTFLKRTFLIDREIAESYKNLISAKQIIVISGVRRAGKSSFLKLIANRLMINHKINSKQIFYVNFDDELFVDFKKEDFNSLLAAYYEVNNIKKGKVYCFFDEIQNVKYWEKWINKLNESGDFKIFITGSNSSLLSSEIATSLTGRNYTLEIFPFSFREFLTYKKNNITQDLDSLSTKNRSHLKRQLNSYLSGGGFAESINSKLDILEENYKNIVYKDIITRFGIKNVAEFRSLAVYLMSNMSSLMSYRSLAKMISGIDSSMTVKNYISYLKDAYLLFDVKKFEPSLKKQLIAPFKIYAIDNGMAKSIAFTISRNYNKLYENAVFLSLRRQRGLDIFYFKDNYETDFVATKKNQIKKVIQVCYNLDNKKTKEREVRGLLEAMDRLKQKQGYIINDYIDQEEIIDGKKVVFIPLYKFLL